jgi:starch synthase (maltosyl-transferring)
VEALKGVFDHWIAEGSASSGSTTRTPSRSRSGSGASTSSPASTPTCIFLAEAFTRPKVMYELAMRGFNQSYTYFTWRRHKWELEEYYTELFHTEVVDFFRPNSWPNTPDILTDQLQHGGRPMFVQRLVLAATLTANYGMYGPAFELMWSRGPPGAEEYLDNEKYEIKTGTSTSPTRCRGDRAGQPHPPRPPGAAAGPHPALPPRRQRPAARLLQARPASGDDVVLVVVNLDPHQPRPGSTWLDLEALGLCPPDAELRGPRPVRRRHLPLAGRATTSSSTRT